MIEQPSETHAAHLRWFHGLAGWIKRRASKSGILVCCVAFALALVSAKTQPGGWNDRSRLATVESLVDYHTLSIDHSLFTKETADKLLINGRFYSDKPLVPAYVMAGLYQVLQWIGGLKATESPDAFCYWMTVSSSGIAYVAAVWSFFRICLFLRFPMPMGLAVTASFGLSTLALTYARQVNGHILLLGVASMLLLTLIRWAQQVEPASSPRFWLLGTGFLAGLGYTIDLGAGPLMLACTGLLVVARERSAGSLVLFGLAALPWLIFHHAVTYSLSHSLLPANMAQAYLEWPGSPWIHERPTGLWRHDNIGHFIVYAAALLVGMKGFLLYNLPLCLVAPGILLLTRTSLFERLELRWGLGWAVGTWMIYALLSTNYSGVAASIRWFVPLLVPGYFIVAVLLREYPRFWIDFLGLSLWGAVCSSLVWMTGPWLKPAGYIWPLEAFGLGVWALFRTIRYFRMDVRKPSTIK